VSLTRVTPHTNLSTKVHFIFRHKNPITGEYEEKHLTGGPVPSIEKATKLYTLVIKYVSFTHIFIINVLTPMFSPDNTYSVTIDNGKPETGSLLTDFQPPVNPPKEIDDPEDQKPADWVDIKRIPDPTATKVLANRNVATLCSLTSYIA